MRLEEEKQSTLNMFDEMGRMFNSKFVKGKVASICWEGCVTEYL